jgi:uncharacterized membrane protein YhaH (DUF805 family)
LYLAAEASPQMTLVRQLLCFTGRSGRRDFWLKGLLPVLGINVLTFVPVVPTGITILYLWPFTAIHVKRLMDRDRSPWLFLLVLVPPISIRFLYPFLDRSPWLLLLLSVNGVAVTWLIIETWFLKGTTGQNRYGPDPVPKGA